jgi:hypothetical protein
MIGFARPLTGVAVLLVIGAVFGWIGPYGTFYDLKVIPRFAYWMLAIPLIAMPTTLAIRMVAHTAPAATWPVPLQALAGALIAGLPSTVVVIALETIFRGAPPITAPALAHIYVSATIMIALISIPIAIMRLHQRATVEASAVAPAAAASPPAAPGSPFLRRISPRHGTALLAIATEDHYLRVTTELGSELILFRLSDAVAELDPASGQQVHRSYWVARRAVASVERDGHRTALILSNGDKIPVSRTYLPALREAGWL